MIEDNLATCWRCKYTLFPSEGKCEEAEESHSATTQAGRDKSTHEEKEKEFHKHYTNVLGTAAPSILNFDWSNLQMSGNTLSDMERPFSDLEVQEAIKLLPSEKAPSPDGFTGIFYKQCWDIIKDDLRWLDKSYTT